MLVPALVSVQMLVLGYSVECKYEFWGWGRVPGSVLVLGLLLRLDASFRV